MSVVPNWLEELKKWVPHLKAEQWTAAIAIGDRPQHFKTRIRNADIVVTQYEFVRPYNAAAKAKRQEKGLRIPHLKTLRWNVLIVDEGHHLANEKSGLSVSLREFRCLHKLILTGTPLQNVLHELWSLLNFLLPKVFESSADFEGWFQSPFQNTPDKKVELTAAESTLIVQRLQKVLEPFMLRREKSKVASELPDVLQRTILCELSEFQLLLSDYCDRGFLPLPTGPDEESSRQTLGGRRKADLKRKICNHPFLAFTEQNKKFPWQLFDPYFGSDAFVRASGKFAVLDVVLYKLKRGGHKVLIFDPWTATLECLERLMMIRQYPYDVITGAVKSEDRQACIDKFIHDPASFVLLVSTHAGGEGLNLQAADTVIVFEGDWNPMRDKQAVARVHRHGQTRTVLELTFVTVSEDFITAEEKKFDVAANKKRMEQAIFSGNFSAQGNQADDEAQRERLMRLHNREHAALEEGSKRISMHDLDRMIARSDEELAMYRSLRMDLPPLLMKAELPLWLTSVKAVSANRPQRTLSDTRKRVRVNYAEHDEDEDDVEDDDAEGGGRRGREVDGQEDFDVEPTSKLKRSELPAATSPIEPRMVPKIRIKLDGPAFIPPPPPLFNFGDGEMAPMDLTPPPMGLDNDVLEFKAGELGFLEDLF